MTKADLQSYIAIGKELKVIERLRDECQKLVNKQIADNQPLRIADVSSFAKIAFKGWLYSPPYNYDKVERFNRPQLTDLLLELCEHYNRKWDELISKRLEIEREIEKLIKPEHKTVMRLRYIEGKKWEKICVELNYSWKHIHRFHAEALLNLNQQL